jgi:acyl-ACP thioesterase
MNLILPAKSDRRFWCVPYSVGKLDDKGNPNFQKLLMGVQNAISDQLDSLGVGTKTLAANGFLYILCRMKMTILRPLAENEELTLVTYPMRPDKVEMRRETYFLDSQSKPVILIDSLWVFINVKTRRLTFTDYFSNAVNKQDMASLDILELLFPERLFELNFKNEVFDFDFTHTVSQEEIDFNNHMNNTYYVSLAQELALKKITGIEINYEKECLLNEKIDVFSFSKPTGLDIIGSKSNQDKAFFVSLKY